MGLNLIAAAQAAGVRKIVYNGEGVTLYQSYIKQLSPHATLGQS